VVEDAFALFPWSFPDAEVAVLSTSSADIRDSVGLERFDDATAWSTPAAPWGDSIVESDRDRGDHRMDSSWFIF
jgi:hypothetical protein